MPHWKVVVARLEQLKRELTTIVGNEMVNNAVDHINNETDIDGNPMVPRQAKRNAGRKLLVDTGKGRRSINKKITGDKVKLVADEHMVAHNQGAKETVQVRSRKGKSFSRKMNLPTRKFTGESKEQTERINKKIASRIIKAAT